MSEVNLRAAAAMGWDAAVAAMVYEDGSPVEIAHTVNPYRDAAERADMKRADVLGEVASERRRQDAKWGEQNHPNGTGPDKSVLNDLTLPSCHNSNRMLAREATNRTDALARHGRCTYEAILTEEWAEAIACEDPALLRMELVQVAAVAVAWVEKVDRDRAALAAEVTPPAEQRASCGARVCSADYTHGPHTHRDGALYLSAEPKRAEGGA